MSIKKLGILTLALLAVLAYSEPVFAGGSITGKTCFVLPAGKKPGRKKIQMAADPVCASKHSEPSLSEVVMVDDEGRLASGITEVLSDAGSPIDLEIGPDGDVYYLSFRGGGFREPPTGEILHIRLLERESTFWSGRNMAILASVALMTVVVLAFAGVVLVSRKRRPATS